MRNPIHVTTISMVEESGSMRKAKLTVKSDRNPPLTWPTPAGIHVKYECSHAAPLVTTRYEAISADKSVDARAKKLVVFLFFGSSGRAKARMPLISAPSAGRSGTSRSKLAIQLTCFIDIDGALQAI